jgi:hypothetical protein
MSTRRRPRRLPRPSGLPAISSARTNPTPSVSPGSGYVCPDQKLTAVQPGALAGPHHLSELFTLARVLPVRWYGSDPAWRAAMEARARREHGSRLSALLEAGRLTYTVELDVPGRFKPVPVMISFYDAPPYDCYGLPPADYPRVHAEPGARSPHRMPTDNALCLWYPLDPPERRWTADKGLLELLDIANSHLLYEAYWRSTEGIAGGIWAGDEAAHGFAEDAA